MAEAISVSGPISGTDKTLSFETGLLAPQSQGAIVGRIGGRRVLPAQPEAGVDLPQSLDVRLAEIGLEALALAIQLKQPPLRVEVVLVHLQILV